MNYQQQYNEAQPHMTMSKTAKIVFCMLCLAVMMLPLEGADVFAQTKVEVPPVGELSAIIYDNQDVELTWDAAEKEIKGYQILRNGQPLGINGAEDVQYTDESLEQGKDYKYTVRAFQLKKQVEWFNKKTKKWQKKKPRKKNRGRKKVSYVRLYGEASSEKTVRIPEPDNEFYGNPEEKDLSAEVVREGTGEGKKLTILSYNVAQYNNDTDVYISEAQKQQFRKLLSDVGADYVGIQEDRMYVDSNNRESSLRSLYQPGYNYKQGKGGPTIYSKGKPMEAGVVSYSNGRVIRYSVFWNNSKRLLIISTHPVSRQNKTDNVSEESIQARQIQYIELMEWVCHKVQLAQYRSGILKTCPAWDYCIICGDFNCHTEQDKKTLSAVVNEKGFSMANGDLLKWAETQKKHIAIDNVICSPNIEIDKAVSYRSLFSQLYSDHYPIAVQVTLLD